MPLEFRGSGVTDYFGFFEFSEGREFLREVLPYFQEETGFGDKKLASILVAPDRADYEAEHAAVTQALKRWQRGQDDLWATKPEKSRSYLMRLEQEMMAASTSRAILKGKADALLTHQARSGAAAFFYGVNSVSYSLKDIYLAQLQAAGIYQRLTQITVVEYDDQMELKATKEEWSLSPVYHVLIPKEGQSYMEAHEFTLKTGASVRVRHQRYGYAFPVSFGIVHRLMVGVEDRDVRSHDVLRYYNDVVPSPAGSDELYKDAFSIKRHYVTFEPESSSVPTKIGGASFENILEEFMVAVDDEVKSIIERAKSSLASDIIF
jgi:hypothetical protein